MSAAEGPPTWIDVCRSHGARHDVPAALLAALDTFAVPFPRGGPPPPPEPTWGDGFDRLEAAWAGEIDVKALTRSLSPEAEGRQPATFARRTAATDGILRRLGSPAARILRVGLHVRLRGILEAPPPRLKRVRALADFYYSHAAQLLHPQWSASPHRLRELVDAAVWRELVPGMRHATLDGLAGGMPVHVNVLRVDPQQIRMCARDLWPMTRAGQTFAEALEPGAVAAVSGGFFLYSEDDIDPPSERHDPVGLLLCGGKLSSPPVFRRAALLGGGDGSVAIRRVGLADVAVHVGDSPLPPSRFVNRAAASVGPDEPSIAVVGERIVAVGAALAVPLNGFVAIPHEGLSPAWQVGGRVSYGPPEVTPGVPAVNGVSGGPLLLQDGEPAIDMRAEDLWGTAPPITFSQDETGDQNLLARMVAGIDADGHVVVAAIDGRNVERALGMTLGDAARLMKHLGCHVALNLDGGSSKRMLIEGLVVDLPSTEIIAGESEVVRIRPVHSALLFQPRT